MKIQYLGPLIEAVLCSMAGLLGSEPTRRALVAKPGLMSTDPVNLVFEVSGDIQGLIIVGMSCRLGANLASHLLGHTVVTFDQTATTALTQLGELVHAQAQPTLAAEGYSVFVRFKTLVRSPRYDFGPSPVPTLQLPLVWGDATEALVQLRISDTLAKAA